MSEISKRKPCSECPFGRATAPGTTGGADPTVYVGQAYGPFLLPCHLDPKYEAGQRDPTILQCAGAAAFRANVGVDVRMPEGMLRCEKDTEKAFATPAELVAHHLQIPLEEAEAILKKTPPARLLQIELRKAGVRPVDKTRLNKK